MHTYATSKAEKGGGYALVLSFPGGELEFGKRRARLNPGTYIYSGSALGGIQGRIGRHRGRFHLKVGKRHWHIDALLERCDSVIAVCARSDERTECRLVRTLASVHGMDPVAGFGSTDCRAGCSGHLLSTNLGFDEAAAAVADAFREIGLEPYECGRWIRGGKSH